MTTSGAALVGVAVTAGLLASLAAQQPSFRASVDLIAVEAQVVDADAWPIKTLTPEQFEVTIDGRQRRVVAMNLIEVQRDHRAPRPLGTGPTASNAVPSGGPPGRLFVLAVDAASFDPGQAPPVVQAARAFIGALEPSDAIGIFTLPPFGPRLDPTTDRAAVRRALDQIAGQRQSRPGQFNLSASEIIDIQSETGGLGSPVTQAPAPARGVPVPVLGSGTTLQRVQQRECRSTGDLGCLEALVSEAALLARHLEERAIQSLNGINALLGLLRDFPGRKTVVVLSGGMTVSDRPGGGVDIGDEARQLGEEAAHANATIYALHIDSGVRQIYAAEARRARDATSVERERRMASRVLDEFAAASGGALLTSLVGPGDIALGRVLRETSAYYLLGVEPANLDRDGRAHRLRVRVNQRGAIVRSRQWVVLRKPAGS